MSDKVAALASPRKDRDDAADAGFEPRDPARFGPTASTPIVPAPAGEGREDEEPCSNGQHCCCCGPGEPCCDCGEIMPSKSCIGEKCWCGNPAAKKVGEEMLADEAAPYRHNLTAYVCARHYVELMGPAGAAQVGVDAPPPNPSAYERGRAAGLEEAAKVAADETDVEGKDFGDVHCHEDAYIDACNDIAIAIRKLIPDTPAEPGDAS